MILLIRHCMPKIDYSKCNYIEAVTRVEEYNNTHDIALEEVLPLTINLKDFLEEEKSMVFVSSMPRALLTARKIFGKKYDIVGDENFIEFDLKVLAIPFLNLKFKTWALISRIMWFARLLKTKRSFREERVRATECAKFLYEKSQDASVALVSHGMLNHFIEKYLATKGYHRTRKVQNGFFSITTLAQMKN